MESTAKSEQSKLGFQAIQSRKSNIYVIFYESSENYQHR